MRLDQLDIPWGEGIFRRTKRISFELSNICNLSEEHKRCPLNLQKERRILPERIVNSVLETCRKFSFQGVFAFHLYNEPGIDPRLVLFLDRIKSSLPRSRVFLLTNGWYLTQTLAEEFEAHGLDFLGISAYSQAEWERLSQIRLGIPVTVIRQRLDDRLSWYVGDDALPVLTSACYCPLYEICITNSGQVCLCPYDWERRHLYGDLNHETLEDILGRPEMWRDYEALAAGRRELDICRGCKTSRGEPHRAADLS